jgi:hypothetical protein
MREYLIDGKQVILMYRYVNEGIDITTKYNDTMFYKHFNNIDLSGYDLLIDLIDDLSYEFIKYVEESNE